MSGRRARAARSVTETALEAVWDRIPDAGCKGLCQDCCGPIGMSEAERARIARRHGIVIHDGATKPGTLDCPALGTDGRCTMYGDRPTICRLWGSVENMPCPHGCTPATGRLSTADGSVILADSLRLDGDARRTTPNAMIRRILDDPIAGPLYERASRGDRTAYPALAAAILDLQETNHAH